MNKTLSLLAALLVGTLPYASAAAEEDTLARGRYLVTIGGCNDCHTAGYAQSSGTTAERDWLLGSDIGFQGAWGTTYATNLRLLAARLDEEEWLVRTASPMRPPMPWFSLARMTVEDRRAIWRYVRSLGPAGTPSPAFVQPGRTPLTPVIVFEPVAPSPVDAPLADTARE